MCAALLAMAVAAAVALAIVLLRNRRPADGRQTADADSVDAGVVAMLGALPNAAFLLDGAGLVQVANQRARETFPATRAGDPFTFTFRSPEVGEALVAAAIQPRSVELGETGESRSLWRIHFAPFDASGRPLVLVLFEDIAEKLALARTRADFVANASHELRTPLASLTGFAETLIGPARSDPEAAARFLPIMLEEARRMRRLIDDLLSLSRAEMRVHSRPTDAVELGGVVARAVGAMTGAATDHGVVLTVAPATEPIAVIGDAEELSQVFQNLLENAIRYGASGKRVEVTIERPTDRRVVRVHVRDFGPGLAAEHLPRLTERFYRVESAAATGPKGTGLGLAIVKHILTRHQGRLDIASRPGEGARFTVELPLSQPAQKVTLSDS
jgi:two-component system phosphate regulon sensor histidine kinase PhoR